MPPDHADDSEHSLAWPLTIISGAASVPSTDDFFLWDDERCGAFLRRRRLPVNGLSFSGPPITFLVLSGAHSAFAWRSFCRPAGVLFFGM
jgi:hypothetical protein